MDLRGFEASLAYILSSRPARATYAETLSQKTKTENYYCVYVVRMLELWFLKKKTKTKNQQELERWLSG